MGTACFLMTLIPIAPLLVAIGFIGNYYADKYVLIYHQSKPRELGIRMSIEMIEQLEFTLIIYCFSICSFRFFRLRASSILSFSM